MELTTASALFLSGGRGHSFGILAAPVRLLLLLLLRHASLAREDSGALENTNLKLNFFSNEDVVHPNDNNYFLVVEMYVLKV